MRCETFRWKHKFYDITALLRDIERGSVRPDIIELERQFIVGYCSLHLDPASSEPRPPIAVDYAYAEALPDERLALPIVLLQVGDNEGLVSLREDVPEPNYVVGDGNHRLLAARRMNATLKGYVLSALQSKSYERPRE